MPLALAGLLGFVLLGAAEWLHRHEAPPVVGPFRTDQAPAGLAAGGTAILFGAAYGAGPFFGLLPPLLAFAAMAVASLIALTSALRVRSRLRSRRVPPGPVSVGMRNSVPHWMPIGTHCNFALSADRVLL